MAKCTYAASQAIWQAEKRMVVCTFAGFRGGVGSTVIQDLRGCTPKISWQPCAIGCGSVGKCLPICLAAHVWSWVKCHPQLGVIWCSKDNAESCCLHMETSLLKLSAKHTGHFSHSMTQTHNAPPCREWEHASLTGKADWLRMTPLLFREGLMALPRMLRICSMNMNAGDRRPSPIFTRSRILFAQQACYKPHLA